MNGKGKGTEKGAKRMSYDPVKRQIKSHPSRKRAEGRQ